MNKSNDYIHPRDINAWPLLGNDSMDISNHWGERELKVEPGMTIRTVAEDGTVFHNLVTRIEDGVIYARPAYGAVTSFLNEEVDDA